MNKLVCHEARIIGLDIVLDSISDFVNYKADEHRERRFDEKNTKSKIWEINSEYLANQESLSK